MTTVPSAYHVRPEPLLGTDLLPLSALAFAAPDLYAREAAKYFDQPGMLERPVEPLRCRWKDCVFLTACHPAPLVKAFRAARLSYPVRRWLAVDCSELDPARSVLMTPACWAPGDPPPPVTSAQCTELTPESLRAASVVDDSVLSRLRDPRNRLPLWAGVVHVLHRGPLDVSRAVTIAALLALLLALPAAWSAAPAPPRRSSGGWRRRPPSRCPRPGRGTGPRSRLGGWPPPRR